MGRDDICQMRPLTQQQQLPAFSAPGFMDRLGSVVGTLFALVDYSGRSEASVTQFRPTISGCSATSWPGRMGR